MLKLMIALLALQVIQPQVDTIAESSVTARRNEVIVPRQTLSGTELQSLSTSTVADALKYFSGVQIKDYGGLGGQKTINVRSLGTQHTGVYIDGIRITNCQNGTVDLGKYSLANMESVELYNANKVSPQMTASEYASAATVYFTTRRPKATSLRALVSQGSFKTNRAQLHASYKTRFFADFEGYHSCGNYPFSYHSAYEDTVGVRKNSDITFYRAECGYFDDHLTGHLYLYSSERGLPGGIVRRLSDKYGDIGREEDFNTFAQLTYRNNWGRHSFKYNTRYAYDKLHADARFLENQFVHYNNTYRQQDFYNGAVYSWSGRRLCFSVSPDLRLSDLRCDVTGMSYLWRSDFKSVASATYDYAGIKCSASVLYTNIKDHSKMATAGRLTRWTPSAHASYTIKDFTIRAFYKTIFRAPTLNDLYYTQVGRRDLKPEYTKQYDLGVTFSRQAVMIQLDAYHNEVKDKIVCIPQGASYNWRMMNYGYVVTNGVDLSARATYKDFSLFVSSTWQDVLDMSDPDDEFSWKHQFLYSPKLSASAILSYHHKGWQASLSHMYCSERYWSYVEEDRMPAYNCTDAKVQYTFKNNITLALECNDIFDVRYEVVQRWPLPGRRFALTLMYELNKIKL